MFESGKEKRQEHKQVKENRQELEKGKENSQERDRAYSSVIELFSLILDEILIEEK